MIISIREAYLGKRELKPSRGKNWILAKEMNAYGWTSEMMEIKPSLKGVESSFHPRFLAHLDFMKINTRDWTVGPEAWLDYAIYYIPSKDMIILNPNKTSVEEVERALDVIAGLNDEEIEGYDGTKIKDII